MVTRTEYLPYAETGFYFYNARYYDGEVCRFITADNVIDGQYDTQGWNRYAYVKNNPVTYKDPTGHEAALDYAKGGDAFAANKGYYGDIPKRSEMSSTKASAKENITGKFSKSNDLVYYKTSDNNKPKQFYGNPFYAIGDSYDLIGGFSESRAKNKIMPLFQLKNQYTGEYNSATGYESFRNSNNVFSSLPRSFSGEAKIAAEIKFAKTVSFVGIAVSVYAIGVDTTYTYQQTESLSRASYTAVSKGISFGVSFLVGTYVTVATSSATFGVATPEAIILGYVAGSLVNDLMDKGFEKLENKIFDETNKSRIP